MTAMTAPAADTVARVRASLPATQWAIEDLGPVDLLHCAEFLTGILSRAPMATGDGDPGGWVPERLILGCLASELRLIAHEAGETTFEPLTFGHDPVAKARQLVESLAAAHDTAERDRERHAGDAAHRAARLQAQWAAEAESA